MKMDNNIKILLEKYYKCETTLEEELMLKKYFSENKVDSKYKSENLIFNEGIDCDVDVSGNIEKLIDCLKDKQIQSNNNTISENNLNIHKLEKPPKKRVLNNRIIVSLAASLIILITVGIFLLNDKNKINPLNNYGDISTYNGIAMTQEEVNETVAEVFNCFANNLSKPKEEINNNIDKALSKLKIVNKKFNNIKTIN